MSNNVSISLYDIEDIYFERCEGVQSKWITFYFIDKQGNEVDITAFMDDNTLKIEEDMHD